ncbi:hypothetical protein X777_05966 [Ooceraea biroi]|uniref:Uncharacterized protein n=1 Tax=Ooceraea biroi TaxID=2015173 RepID=A0A026WEQ1_OOCBI|nr:hypothetical protein X777_05966 [Ooceraea biroi]
MNTSNFTRLISLSLAEPACSRSDSMEKKKTERVRKRGKEREKEGKKTERDDNFAIQIPATYRGYSPPPLCAPFLVALGTPGVDPGDEARGETRRGKGGQMSVKVTGEKLADTRSKVSLAPSDRLRLDACALFGGAATITAAAVSSAFHPFLSLSPRDERSPRARETSGINWPNSTPECSRILPRNLFFIKFQR